jgi:hypothetical protein
MTEHRTVDKTALPTYFADFKKSARGRGFVWMFRSATCRPTNEVSS